MKECCETGEPKRRRRGRWFLLGGIALVGGVIFAAPKVFQRYFIKVCSKSVVDISAICASLEEYAINNNGAYPTSLEPLVAPDANGRCYLEGYNGKIPLDPWKRPYHYEIPTSAYPRPHVWTYGADGRLGGTGENADTDSEEMRERE